MKLTCLQENLSRAIRYLQILGNKGQVYLAAEGTSITITGTDLMLIARCRVPAKIDESGAITLPLDPFGSIISQLPAGDVVIESTGHKLQLSYAGTKVRLIGTTESPLPSNMLVIPTEMALSSKELSAAIRATKFAAPENEKMGLPQGVLLHLDGEARRFVATDGFRLSCYTLKLTTDKQGDYIIPLRAWEGLRTILQGRDESVEIGFSENQGCFRLAEVELWTLLMNTKFPHYEKLLEGNYTHKALIPRKPLLDAVKLAMSFSKITSMFITLDILFDSVSVISSDTELGNAYSEIPAQITGDSVKCTYRGDFLLGVLESMIGDGIVFQTEGPTSAGVFLDVALPQYTHFIMPATV